MQIVKIFPNNKNKCHFSIRKKNNNRFYVFEGDIILRSDLESINDAETEISLIVLARQKNNLKVVPVKYAQEVIEHETESNMPEKNKSKRKFKLSPKNCVICEKEFMSIRSNHLCCSRQCSIKQQTEKTKSKKEPENHTVLNPPYERKDTFLMTEDDINEFHELTEKQMRLSERKKRVKEISSNVVDYVLNWFWVNHNLGHPQSYFVVFNEISNYKIFDITRNQLVSLFDEYVTYDGGQMMTINGGVNFFSVKKANKTKEKLVNLIYEEEAIPNDEQIAKSSVLRLMTSQLKFIVKQQYDLKMSKVKSEAEKVEKPKQEFNLEVYTGIVEMITNLNNQNKLIFDKIGLITEKQDGLYAVHSQNIISVERDMSDLVNCLERLTQQVNEINKKRRLGFFKK